MDVDQFRLSSLRNTTYTSLSAPLSAVGQLRLSWVGDQHVSSGFRSYIRYNEARGLVASGAGTCHLANVLEIYEADSMQLQLRHETDASSCWCMTWLPEDLYSTGSNDSHIRIWRDGVMLHE